MSKNILFCADGTWNRPDDTNSEGLDTSTNVWKLFSALQGAAEICGSSWYQKQTAEQIAFYDDGVGTNHDVLFRLLGGSMGFGATFKVVTGYLVVCQHYQPGDRVYVFGFSRGAYIARTLAAMISHCGLIAHDGKLSPGEILRAGKAYQVFREGDEAKLQAFHQEQSPRACPIEMVGVWDTVGALGIPVGFLGGVSETLFEFRDCRLSDNVRFGCHAVALDEHREAFETTLWESRSGLEQVWFAGAHCDVGGGYAQTGLSDIALKWMIDKAAGHGVLFGAIPRLSPDALAPIHDSYRKIMGAYVERRVPDDAVLHVSVAERIKLLAAYRPKGLTRLAGSLDPTSPAEPYTVA